MVLPQEKGYTYADMLAWEEDELVELIYGTPVMMSPPTRRHQRIVGDLSRQLGNYLLGKKCEVYHEPFGVRLFEKEGDQPCDVNTLVMPDVVVVCDPDKLDDAGCKGTPDLVIEVLSPSTQRHDRLVKFRLYQQAGVPEYWIVDPAMRVVSVHTLEDGQYGSPIVYTDSAKIPVGVLEDCQIDLCTVFPKEG